MVVCYGAPNGSVYLPGRASSSIAEVACGCTCLSELPAPRHPAYDWLRRATARNIAMPYSQNEAMRCIERAFMHFVVHLRNSGLHSEVACGCKMLAEYACPEAFRHYKPRTDARTGQTLVPVIRSNYRKKARSLVPKLDSRRM